jgi:hypothetical protein
MEQILPRILPVLSPILVPVLQNHDHVVMEYSLEVMRMLRVPLVTPTLGQQEAMGLVV